MSPRFDEDVDDDKTVVEKKTTLAIRVELEAFLITVGPVVKRMLLSLWASVSQGRICSDYVRATTLEIIMMMMKMMMMMMMIIIIIIIMIIIMCVFLERVSM